MFHRITAQFLLPAPLLRPVLQLRAAAHRFERVALSPGTQLGPFTLLKDLELCGVGPGLSLNYLKVIGRKFSVFLLL